ncbi:glycoside hydrolase family 31 [Mucilaginibacter hurinus]|uniref:Glycoside hydrolase family 31 n=1 Tax=Mucilaginibacter hurinus TaxID=2201324 RepID=A0A367GQF3_9SPHI|nr:glycoside hydrolase family 31 protein [Mucilaginibacter hurinus]RCH55694.1 glycoside hydrolase family 31 [Mucilaginibacter hurinus]
MKFYLIKPLLLSLMLSAPAYGQSTVQQIGNVSTVNINGQQVNIKLDNAEAQVSVYTPSVIRVRIDRKKLADDFSYAVTGRPLVVKTTITQDDNQITVVTDSVRAVIQKKPFSVAFYTPEGKVISEDEKGLHTSWAGEAVTTYKKMQEWEHFVGLGEKTGPLDRKGSGYTNWNSDVFGYAATQDPLYSTIPFYIGIHHGLNYGLFLDNTYQTDFNFGASNNRFSSFGARGGEMNYYFIYHKKVADIINSYTWLTGKMPLPPLWSLGYQQNRYSYYPEAEVMRVARTLREKRIPADGITLDIHYMEAYKLFTWNKDRFPDPLKMNTELNKMGLRTTVIVDPGIKVEKGAGAYERGKNDGIYIKYPDGQPYTGQVWPGWCNFPDFTDPKGRAWWRKEVKFFAQSGVSGIWNDMNEIATWGQKMPDNVLFDYDGKKANHLQAHNVYGLQMIRASYEGAREQFKERPFLLTRSGYAGLQRYSALWTGDNRSEEDHMMAGVRLLNSLGLSGVAFSGMDVGGFTGNPTVGLYTRWMELGAFTPYFRNHTQLNSKSSEPWSYGEDVLDIARNYISLRYQLLPYLYSSFYEATQTGMPVMRSLAINYTHDPRIFDWQFQNQYEFGNGLMVAPFESTKEFGKIYFPAGKWYDFYNDATQAGGEDKIVQLNINKLPVYVRGGSIIPVQSLVQTTSQLPTDTLTVHIYHGNSANSFVYYEDDGKSYDHEKGGFYKREISFLPAKNQISFGKPEGKYKTHFKFIKLVLHGFDANNINVSGRASALTSSEYGWLTAAASTDPTGGAYQPEKCRVKYLVFNNEPNLININY